MPEKKKAAPRRARGGSQGKTSPDIVWRSFIDASTHDVRRLDSVVRFSSIPVTFSETTAAHSYWVSLYSLMIWQTLEAAGRRKSLPPLADVLRHAITHDAKESVTGDVVRTLKYSSVAMKQMIDSSESSIASRLLPPQVLDAFLPSVDPRVKSIVKAADFLSLWQFMRREAARHNLEILPYYERMVSDLRAMTADCEVVFEPLYSAMVAEAEEVARDCFGDLVRSPRWRRTI